MNIKSSKVLIKIRSLNQGKLIADFFSTKQKTIQLQFSQLPYKGKSKRETSFLAIIEKQSIWRKNVCSYNTTIKISKRIS
jgi:hypothetical protein